MPGIENITDKITRDAKIKAALMISEARQKAADEAKIITEETDRETRRITEQAGVLASRRREQIAAKTDSEIRDKKLEAKQKAIDSVFSESLRRLENLSPGELESFAADYCKKAGLKEGDLIVLPDKYGEIDIKKIDPRLSLYSGERKISGGFILISGDIEQNNTFSALLDFLRNDIEPEVVSMLF